MAPPPNHHQLPESTPNPSLTYSGDDYHALDLTASIPRPTNGSNGNGHNKHGHNGNGGHNGHHKMRIPMERRSVSLLAFPSNPSPIIGLC